MSTARDEILGRIRSAVKGNSGDDVPIERDYLTQHVPQDADGIVELLAENLADYRAHVHHCREAEVPEVIRRLLSENGDASVVVPEGLPAGWVGSAGIVVHRETPSLAARELDAIDAVVSTCALAIAETGTIVLDAGPGQGRRMLTLVPDHHVCVVRTADQVVASVPLALPRLDPTRPLTWIAGPSATSDIELDRVEGVHGPRRLDVVLVAPR